MKWEQKNQRPAAFLEINPLSPLDAKRAREACKEIAADMEADAKAFDGKPFNGRTVAEYFGNQGAAIAALAKILDNLLEEVPSHDEMLP